MKKEIQTFIQSFREISYPLTRNVLVAVSGGIDSMVMLSLFLQTQSLLNTHIEVTHINHHLRNSDSDADEQFVSSYCQLHSVPIHIHHITEELWNQAEGTGMEEKARAIRYRFFEQDRKENSLHLIAVGHNLNDLCETFCFNLIRGSSPEKLSELLPIWDSSRYLFRPLLRFSRSTLANYASDHSIAFREDYTNQDTCFSRNQIRHNILPQIQKINPKFSSSILRFQTILSSENEWIQKESEAFFSAYVKKQKVQIRKTDFVSIPTALQRRFILLLSLIHI